jgi:hypothetical protein
VENNEGPKPAPRIGSNHYVRTTSIRPWFVLENLRVAIRDLIQELASYAAFRMVFPKVLQIACIKVELHVRVVS